MASNLWFAKSILRKILESVGFHNMSNTSYAGTLASIRSYLPEKGVFIEAGAVDGVFESNTYELERFHGWTGLLVEPSLIMYKRLSFNRPNSTSFNCALVSQADEGKPIRLMGEHATASVNSLGSCDTGSQSGTCVSGRSISSILDEVDLKNIDFLSLDVEGFEIQVLSGIDFSRHAIKVILVECLDDQALAQVKAFLIEKGYRLEKQVTHRDFLFISH